MNVLQNEDERPKLNCMIVVNIQNTLNCVRLIESVSGLDERVSGEGRKACMQVYFTFQSCLSHNEHGFVTFPLFF